MEILTTYTTQRIDRSISLLRNNDCIWRVFVADIVTPGYNT